MVEEKDRPILVIYEDDVWELAKSEGIEIPEDKHEDVIYYVKKYIESYVFDGGYNIWDAIKDAIKEALKGE